MRVYVGTSGWRYGNWAGSFYPEGLPAGQTLIYYARFFSAVEVNSTYYRTPTENVLRAWAKKTPRNFVFSLKVPRKAVLSTEESYFEELARRLSAMDGKLACLLWLLRKKDPWHPSFAELLSERLPEVEVVVENRSGAKVEGFVLCGYHSPSSVFFPEGEKKVVYFRFHGKGEWYKGTYEYEEIEKVLLRLRDSNSRAEKCFLFFNNTATEGGLISAARAMEVAEGMGFEVMKGEETLFF